MSDWKDLNEYRECEDETVQQARNKEEIDRLRANEGSLCEKIRALTDENKRLRANQIPGRCGECAHLIHTDTDPGYCEVAQSWWGKSEFCNRFEPKGE